MTNYKFCNLILKKQYNISNSDYYKIYYLLLSNNIKVKHLKNCLIFNKFSINIKIFINGIITLTGIKINNLNKKTIDDFTQNINDFIHSYLNTLPKFENLEQYHNFFTCNQSNNTFLLDDSHNFVGIKSNDKIILHNIQVDFFQVNDDFYYTSCNNKNKSKTLFKNGHFFGTLDFELFNSKKFFQNSTISIDYINKVIYSNNKLIGNVNISPVQLPQKKQIIDNDFTIVSCNIQLNLNKNINRYNLFFNLLKHNYIVEYKLFDYSAVSLYYDNVVVSIFKSGQIIVKGISNNSNIDNLNDYIESIKNIILLNS